MSPFKVNQIIKQHDKMCLDSLCRECNIQFRHRFFKMSDDLFFCEECGTSRHYVKKVSFYGWLKLPFYNVEYMNF